MPLAATAAIASSRTSRVQLGSKASAEASAEADAARLRAHAEAYRPQLEAYAGLFAGEALPRRLAVFYVARGKLVTLD